LRTIKEVIADKGIEKERLTANEKIRIVQELQHKGLFRIKGAVSEVAALVLTSEATIYRYLSKINKNFGALIVLLFTMIIIYRSDNKLLTCLSGYVIIN
jgi:DNA invertase Pin-like site-specific DNA recombinase